MSRDLLRLYTINIVVKSYRAVAFHRPGTNVLAFVLILSTGSNKATQHYHDIGTGKLPIIQLRSLEPEHLCMTTPVGTSRSFCKCLFGIACCKVAA